MREITRGDIASQSTAPTTTLCGSSRLASTPGVKLCSTSKSAVTIADGSERKREWHSKWMYVRTEEENLPLDLIVVGARLHSVATCREAIFIIDWLRRTVKFRASKAGAAPSMRRNPTPADDNAGADAGNQGHGR